MAPTFSIYLLSRKTAPNAKLLRSAAAQTARRNPDLLPNTLIRRSQIKASGHKAATTAKLIVQGLSMDQYCTMTVVSKCSAIMDAMTASDNWR
jgi:hypothetical protein